MYAIPAILGTGAIFAFASHRINASFKQVSISANQPFTVLTN